MRRYEIRNKGLASRRWLAVLLVALGAGLVGAFSFASQEDPAPKLAPQPQNTVIRTTPDAPQDVPPPVAPARQARAD